MFDVDYYDREGNAYSYKFEKSGYDKLYINNTDEYFRHLCYEGFKERYPEADQELKDRLEYEISTIEQMGL